MQAHELTARRAEKSVGPIVLVKRLEDDYLVARIRDREQRGDHPFRGSAADRYFPLGVNVEPIMAAIFRRDGIAEYLSAPGDRVLIDFSRDRIRGRSLDDFRSRKIGKALRQIY